MLVIHMYMAAPNPELNFLVLGGAALAVAGAVAAQLLYTDLILNAPPYVDFEKLRSHLESKPGKKDTVNVQGTVIQEEAKCVRSNKGEVEGAARRVVNNGYWRRGELCTNLSVSFLLRDFEAPGNTIRVLEVHKADGLDSVMQLVSNERGNCEKILTFGTRVWIRGCARIEGDTILINPTKIHVEAL